MLRNPKPKNSHKTSFKFKAYKIKEKIVVINAKYVGAILVKEYNIFLKAAPKKMSIGSFEKIKSSFPKVDFSLKKVSTLYQLQFSQNNIQFFLFK